MMLTTPGGMPASLSRPANFSAVRGVISEGWGGPIGYIAIGLMATYLQNDGVPSRQRGSYFPRQHCLEEREPELVYTILYVTYHGEIPWYDLALAKIQYFPYDTLRRYYYAPRLHTVHVECTPACFRWSGHNSLVPWTAK